MNNTSLKNKTIKQLQSKLNFNKTIAIALIIVIAFLTAISLYGLIAKDNVTTFISLLAVACTSWSFIPLSFNLIKEIKTELKLRAQVI
jgi:hypothetical protein